MAMKGFEPIYMHVSGGHMLTPVQTLVATLIFALRKCISNPSHFFPKIGSIPHSKGCGLILPIKGFKPIYMHVSDGHMLTPVQTLVATLIFASRKCISNPSHFFP